MTSFLGRPGGRPSATNIRANSRSSAPSTGFLEQRGRRLALPGALPDEPDRDSRALEHGLAAQKVRA